MLCRPIISLPSIIVPVKVARAMSPSHHGANALAIADHNKLIDSFRGVETANIQKGRHASQVPTSDLVSLILILRQIKGAAQ